MSAPAPHTPSSAVPPAPPASQAEPLPGQVQLDALIRAGVVTHLVNANEPVDPIFVVGQMRDIADITFAAAFQDGLIALGCHGKLPKALEGVATRALPVTPSTSPDPGMRKLDRLAQRFEFLLSEMPQQVSVDMKGITDRLDRLEAATTDRAMNRALAPLTDQLGALHHRLDLADENPPVEADLSAVLAELEKLDARIDALNAKGLPTDQTDLMEALRHELRRRPAPDEEFRAEIAGLRDGIAAIQSTATATSVQTADYDKFTAVLSMMVKRTDAAAAEVRRALSDARHPPQVVAALETLAERVDQLDTAPDITPVLERLGQVHEILDAQTRDQSALAPIAAQLDALHDRLSEATVPTPEHHAQLGHLFVALDGLRNAVIALEADRPDLAPVLERLDSLTRQGDALPIRLETLHADVLRAADRPEPVFDISAIEEGLTALQARPLPTIDLTPLEESIAALADRQDPIPTLSMQQETLARIATDLAALGERPDGTATALQALSEDVAALLARPDALNEIRAHKEAFARLSSALAATTARLDALGGKIMEDDAAIQSALRALPAEMQRAVEKAADPAALSAQLSNICAQLDRLPDTLDLGGLRDGITGLTARKDPDAALQNQQDRLSRLGKAMTMLVDRLDHMAGDPALAEAVTAEGDRLSAALTQVERRLTGLARDHSEELSTLALRLDPVRRKARDGSGDVGDFALIRAEVSDALTQAGTAENGEGASEG